MTFDFQEFFLRLQDRLGDNGIDLFVQFKRGAPGTVLFMTGHKDGLYAGDYYNQRDTYTDEIVEIVYKAIVTAFDRAEKRKARG